MVATRDEGLQTHVTRGWGGQFDPEHRQLAVALNVSPDSDVIRDLEANGAIAVTLADPTTYRAVQLTGFVEWVGDLTDEDRRRVADHIDRFVEAVASIGMPPESVRLAGEQFVAVQVQVHQTYEQTPGPGAGSPL